jgi:PIN domain nuclease of toxin-antitoxin system
LPVEDWIANAEALPFFKFVPVDKAIAFRSVNLPGTLHPDPADRILVATALDRGVALVTKDERLRNYPHIKTLW